MPTVLVTYATKAGSTAGVAQKIAEQLQQKQCTVDLMPVDQVKDLSPYQTIILGSGIRGGSFFTEANRFIEINKSTLARKNTHVFLVCLTMHQNTPENRRIAEGYLDPIHVYFRPKSEGLFGGVYYSANHNLMERLIMKAMNAPEGDFRHWNEIAVWVDQVAKTIQN
jgi:menaquinone-dependent protoporphyrinogen oxidase